MWAWLLAAGVPASAALWAGGWRRGQDSAMFAGAIGCIAFLAAALIAAGVQRKREAHAAYMADCQQHRPAYECTLLWKATESRGGSGDPLIIPVPIPVR